jgi:hypothetical protein
MKRILNLSLLIAILVILITAPATAWAQTPTPQPGNTSRGDQVIIGNTFRLESGDTLDGNLLVIGGTATISKGAVVNGDTVLIGGTVTSRGTMTGDIVAIGGAVNIEDYAIVNGNLVMIGANLNRSPLAEINGSVSNQSPGFLDFKGDNKNIEMPFLPTKDPLRNLLNTSLQALALSILAVVIGLFLPGQMQRVKSTLMQQPLIAGGVGLLTLVLAPIILVLLAITIILIPVSAIAIIILALAFLFGFVAVGFEIGERMAQVFKTTWHPSISAGIGTLLLSLVTGIAGLVPCIGWLIGLIVGILGLGAVVISRFGSSKYAARVVQAVVPSTSTPEQKNPDDQQG